MSSRGLDGLIEGMPRMLWAAIAPLLLIANGLVRRARTAAPAAGASLFQASEAERAWRWVKDAMASSRLEILSSTEISPSSPTLSIVSLAGCRYPSFDQLVERMLGYKKLLGLWFTTPLTDPSTIKHKLCEGEKGVMVEDVDLSSPAAERGVKAGDVIVEVAGRAVDSVDDIVKLVNEQKRYERENVLLGILDGKGGLRMVAVPAQCQPYARIGPVRT
jgi:C-terminal processing protease CtpA/Prc